MVRHIRQQIFMLTTAVQMENNQNSQLTVNAPYGSNFINILDFFISGWKNWPLSRDYFGRLGRRFSPRCCCEEVALLERFQKESPTPHLTEHFALSEK